PAWRPARRARGLPPRGPTRPSCGPARRFRCRRRRRARAEGGGRGSWGSAESSVDRRKVELLPGLEREIGENDRGLGDLVHAVIVDALPLAQREAVVAAQDEDGKLPVLDQLADVAKGERRRGGRRRRARRLGLCLGREAVLAERVHAGGGGRLVAALD